MLVVVTQDLHGDKLRQTRSHVPLGSGDPLIVRPFRIEEGGC